MGLRKYKEYNSGINLGIGDEVKCIKSLYKSTYLRNAFNKGKKYSIYGVDRARNVIWVIDELGQKFTFQIEELNFGVYYMGEYFIVHI